MSSSNNPKIHDGHTSRVFAACFHPRSNYELLTGGWDDVIHFWDLRQPHAIRHISGVHMCGQGIDINSKGTEILTCAFQTDNAFQIFDYSSGKLISTLNSQEQVSKLYVGRFVGKDYAVCGGTNPNLFHVIDLSSNMVRFAKLRIILQIIFRALLEFWAYLQLYIIWTLVLQKKVKL